MNIGRTQRVGALFLRCDSRRICISLQKSRQSVHIHPTLIFFFMPPLSYSIFVLQCFGMWHCDDHLTGWKAKLYIAYTGFIFLFVYSLTLSLFIISYAFINDANEFAEASYMLLTLIAGSGKMFNLIHKRNLIRDMLKTLQRDPFYPQDEKELAINSEGIRKTRLYTFMYAILVEFACTMLTLTSFSRDIPRGKLPYKSWLPFDTSRPIAYWIAFLHQTIGCHMVSNIDIGFDCLVPGLMMVARTQLKILKHRFKKIHRAIKDTINPHSNTSGLEHRIRMEKILVTDCIRHHKAIIQFTKTSNEIFAVPIFLQYCASSILLCVSTYRISQIVAYDTEFFCLITYLTAMLTEIYILCRYATEVELESGSVIDAIYSSDWNFFTVNTQKSIIIIITRMLRPIKYKVAHIKLSLDSFTSLLKLSYSVYNLLQKKS